MLALPSLHLITLAGLRHRPDFGINASGRDLPTALRTSDPRHRPPLVRLSSSHPPPHLLHSLTTFLTRLRIPRRRLPWTTLTSTPTAPPRLGLQFWTTAGDLWATSEFGRSRLGGRHLFGGDLSLGDFVGRLRVLGLPCFFVIGCVCCCSTRVVGCWKVRRYLLAFCSSLTYLLIASGISSFAVVLSFRFLASLSVTEVVALTPTNR